MLNVLYILKNNIKIKKMYLKLRIHVQVMSESIQKKNQTKHFFSGSFAQ